jgi:hypothetical protein
MPPLASAGMVVEQGGRLASATVDLVGRILLKLGPVAWTQLMKGEKS